MAKIELSFESGAAHPPPSIGKASFMQGAWIVEPTVRACSIRRGCCDHGSQWEVPSMKLSAPVYHLKRKAKLLSREANMPLHEALDRIAIEEGFGRWSLLAAKLSALTPAGRLFPQLQPGDLVLVGARPGHGKTLICLELAIEAMKAGHRSLFFTLEYTSRDVSERFRDLGVDDARFEALFTADCSDAINAGYIIERMGTMPCGTLAVVDYLQLLDQRRENPPLMVQVRALKSFAREKRMIIVFSSQIDRSYDAAVRSLPDLTDVRLPNPLDLALFSKTCFLNSGDIQFRATG
ncbi:DNA helicase [Dongia soli]|uniref:DNA helicase n=1 Tax=Dongia soli TaxID=600628 RepID=A0ABU5E6Z7_9PROT|nr:DNA helicase [Dongia soli]MDY0882087.1 DNA helicase [Dongia soli]